MRECYIVSPRFTLNRRVRKVDLRKERLVISRANIHLRRTKDLQGQLISAVLKNLQPALFA